MSDKPNRTDAIKQKAFHPGLTALVAAAPLLTATAVYAPDILYWLKQHHQPLVFAGSSITYLLALFAMLVANLFTADHYRDNGPPRDVRTITLAMAASTTAAALAVPANAGIAFSADIDIPSATAAGMLLTGLTTGVKSGIWATIETLQSPESRNAAIVKTYQAFLFLGSATAVSGILLLSRGHLGH